MNAPQEMLLTDDIEAGAMDQRKQALAMLLLKQLQQNQPSVQAPPGGYNAPGVLGKLPLSAVLMNAGAQGIAQSDLASADAAAAARRQKTQQDYLAGVQGFNAATDKEAAIAQLMTSQNPMLRQMAEAQAKVLREQKEKEAERKQKAAIEAAKLRGDFGDLPGAEQTLRDTAINPNAPLPTPKQPVFSENATSDGKKIPTMTNFNSKGVPTATMGGAPTVSIDQRATGAGTEKFLGAGVDAVVENAKAARAAHALNISLDTLESKSENGIISGPATVPLTWLAGLAKSAGLPIDATKLQNTEVFNSTAQEAVQNLIGQMPRGNAGITKEEAARIALIMPSAAQSAETRQEIVDIMRRANQRTLNAFRQSVTSLQEGLASGNVGKIDMTNILVPETALTERNPTGLPTKAPQKAPTASGPVAAPGNLPGGQTAEIMQERIRIVQSEFDKEPPGPTKEALGRELAKLKASIGSSATTTTSGMPDISKMTRAQKEAELRRLTGGK